MARYRYGSLTPIGSDGVHIPDRVDVNFTRELSAPVRTMILEVRQGVPLCTEMHMVAKPQGRGVRPADLRSIDLTNWIENVFSECIWHVDDSRQPQPQPGSAIGRKAIRDAVKPGRQRISRELLELAADIYRKHIDGQPLKAVERELCVPQRTAARYIEMCRADEYQILPPTTKGKRKA
ncbi:hypothetical protein MAV101_03565 [Mycobacterium avium subsp. hominissuis 101]|nr:hypothetical protein MAV101_03565 [Mycobacterium avium subsp. hominissuis 101]